MKKMIDNGIDVRQLPTNVDKRGLGKGEMAVQITKTHMQAIMLSTRLEEDMWREAVEYAWHVHGLLCLTRNASPQGNGPRPLQQLSRNNIDAEECDRRKDYSIPPGSLALIHLPGKHGGAYCRFRTDGSTEGEYIDHPRPTTSPPTAVMSTPSPSFRLYQAQRDNVASKARRKLFAPSATPISPISVTTSNFSLPNLNLDYSKHNHCNSHQAPTPKRFYCMDTSSTTPQSDINFSASNFHNNKG